MSVDTVMRPDDEGNPSRTPHPVIKGTIRNIGAERLGIDIKGGFWTDGTKLESSAVPINEAGQQLYYELEGGEQTNFEIETDTESEPTRFELSIKTLPAGMAEVADIQQWLEADKNGCV
jgi:hypothetical protein